VLVAGLIAAVLVGVNQFQATSEQAALVATQTTAEQTQRMATQQALQLALTVMTEGGEPSGWLRRPRS